MSSFILNTYIYLLYLCRLFSFLFSMYFPSIGLAFDKANLHISVLRKLLGSDPTTLLYSSIKFFRHLLFSFLKKGAPVKFPCPPVNMGENPKHPETTAQNRGKKQWSNLSKQNCFSSIKVIIIIHYLLITNIVKLIDYFLI